MKQNRKVGLVVMAMAFGVTSVALAAEHGGQTTTTKTTSAVPAALPAQTKQVQGSVTALDLQSLTPTLALKDANGQVWTLGIDPKGTTVWSGGQAGNLGQLKVGSQVKIRYEEQVGRKLAKKIELVQSPVTAASSGTQQANQ